MGRKRGLLTVCLALATAGSGLGAPREGYTAKEKVAKPTRIDWTFILATQSFATPPKDWLPADYDSADQQYELFVPARKDSKKPLPLIVFVSPSDTPSGWAHFGRICRSRGILYAGVRGAGNNCPPKKRVRIILDVLDDVHRRLPTDPDRTYLAGFSGGARMACAVAFAVPEYFGGVLAIGAAGGMRDELWLRRRVAERLSVALAAGASDFNRGEVERFRGPQLKEYGVRTRVWIQAGQGHLMPTSPVLQEAVAWLEEAAPRRAELAKRYPASRAPATAPTRQESARALLEEGRKRAEQPKTMYVGLLQLQGLTRRWPDLPEAKQAERLLNDYARRSERPWEADDVAEQRRYLLATARALDGYASGKLPAQYEKERPGMVKQAIGLWKKVLIDTPDGAAGKQAKERIAELTKLLK
jgi:hypothetical protein